MTEDTQTPTSSAVLQITEREKRRLEEMMSENKGNGGLQDDLRSLEAKLDRASIVKSEAIPRNFVTMKSQISVVDQESLERMQFRLVYPDQASPEDHKVSILSSMGLEVLGQQIGHEFTAATPEGTRRFVIAKVDYQPEAANTYRL